MKYLFLIIWFISVSVFADTAKFYTLEDSKGRSLEVNILSVDPTKETVRIKLHIRAGMKVHFQTQPASFLIHP